MKSGYGGIGRRARFRFWWETVQVQVLLKKFLALVESGDKKAATALFPKTCSTIDCAVSKGVLKKNTAANKKSGLAKKLNAMA